jgi:RNA polymerase sigma-70 factor (ECF subfamily)
MTHINQIPLSAGVSGLGQLFEHERAHLRRFLERRINRKIASRLDASDVIQEVFFRAQQALPAYLSNPVIPPLIWLRHLSVQVLCEVHRKQFRGIRSPDREENQFDKLLVTSLSQSSMSISSKVEKLDLQAKIRAKLVELNQIDREVLEMRHVDGYSLAEIAKMLDIQLETIKKRYYRALKRFKDMLGESTGLE